MTSRPTLLTPRSGETDEETRLREALDRLGGQIIATLDAAICLRTAQPETQRERHRVRGSVRDALVQAMSVHDMHIHLGATPKPQKQRTA